MSNPKNLATAQSGQLTAPRCGAGTVPQTDRHRNLSLESTEVRAPMGAENVQASLFVAFQEGRSALKNVWRSSYKGRKHTPRFRDELRLWAVLTACDVLVSWQLMTIPKVWLHTRGKPQSCVGCSNLGRICAQVDANCFSLQATPHDSEGHIVRQLVE